MTSRNTGFTLTEILVVVSIMAMIVAIATPAFTRAREVSRARGCQENLLKIDGAKEQYAIENATPSWAQPTWSDLVASTLFIKRMPRCPGGGSYYINSLDAPPACDYQIPSWLDGRYNHKF